MTEPASDLSMGDIAQVPLDPKGHALIESADWPLVSGCHWTLDDRGYAAALINGRIVRMHRLIVNAKAGELVDHINMDRLDNRRCNLRICSVVQNQQNRGKPRTRALISSRYKGVSWDKCNRRWRAKIVADGRQQHLGYFDDEIAAARAYERAALEHFGEYARLGDLPVDSEVSASTLGWRQGNRA